MCRSVRAAKGDVRNPGLPARCEVSRSFVPHATAMKYWATTSPEHQNQEPCVGTKYVGKKFIQYKNLKSNRRGTNKGEGWPV